MTVRTAQFADRAEAGRLLGTEVAALGLDSPVVVGMARGGVPVAVEVARVLGAPLEVLVVRKLGYPRQPELGVGALAEGGTEVLDEPLISRLGLSDAEVESLARHEQAELERRTRRFRRGRPRTDLRWRNVVLVDDGLATGFTARAAVEACRRSGAAKVVLAVPVGAPTTVAALASVADVVVCLRTPPEFAAVGQFYDDFTQVSDDEVQRLLEVSATSRSRPPEAASAPRPVEIPMGGLTLHGDLAVPPAALGVVVFAHGSGSSRRSPRNRAVAEQLNATGLATLLFDLLTEAEADNRDVVFDVDLLAQRLEWAIFWVRDRSDVSGLPIGLFGASTGAAAALVAAADLGDHVHAVVSRGGRPDLAGHRLAEVISPTLLLVGGLDHAVLALNRSAKRQLRCASAIEVIPGATHLFEEPGTLDAVARLASQWFVSAFREAGRPR